MKTSTKDKAKGRIQQATGKIKETVGRIANDPQLVNEGKADVWKGKARRKLGDVEKVFEE